MPRLPRADPPAGFATDEYAPTRQSVERQPAFYLWFVVGLGSWFTAFGMQGVLFSWLVVGVLRADAEWVGVAQSALMLPSIVLVLLAGWWPTAWTAAGC